MIYFKLKPLLIFSLSILLFHSNVNAQNFKLMLSSGINFSQVNGDKLAGFHKLGLVAGAGVSRKISNNQQWSFEFLYSEKGSKDIVTLGDPIQDTIFKFNYIEIPFCYHYQFKPKLNLQFGVYTAVNIKSVYSDGLENYDISEQIYATDYGILGGLSYELSPQTKIQTRLSTSVLDINHSIERYYNLVLSMGISYTL
jgi:hypothetical protein